MTVCMGPRVQLCAMCARTRDRSRYVKSENVAKLEGRVPCSTRGWKGGGVEGRGAGE